MGGITQGWRSDNDYKALKRTLEFLITVICGISLS